MNIGCVVPPCPRPQIPYFSGTCLLFGMRFLADKCHDRSPVQEVPRGPAVVLLLLLPVPPCNQRVDTPCNQDPHRYHATHAPTFNLSNSLLRAFLVGLLDVIDLLAEAQPLPSSTAVAQVGSKVHSSFCSRGPPHFTIANRRRYNAQASSRQPTCECTCG